MSYDYELRKDAVELAHVIQDTIEDEITRQVEWSNQAEKYDGDRYDLLILLTAKTMCERMLTEITIKNK